MKFVESTKFKALNVHDLQDLKLPVLVDLLSQHTATYTKLLAEGSRTEEFEAVKQLIKILQTEIESRKTVPGFIPLNGNPIISG